MYNMYNMYNMYVYIYISVCIYRLCIDETHQHIIVCFSKECIRNWYS